MAASPNAAPQAGSRQYEPLGKRYSIDRNALSYMGWTLQARAHTCPPHDADCPALPQQYFWTELIGRLGQHLPPDFAVFRIVVLQ